MTVAMFVLMVAGVILSSLVRRLQSYLLRWRPADDSLRHFAQAAILGE